MGFFAPLLCLPILCAFDLLYVPSYTTVHPQVYDLVPGDGVLDAGSLANPYIIEGPYGPAYTIVPQVPDLIPNDGILDSGSFTNPWVVEPVD